MGGSRRRHVEARDQRRQYTTSKVMCWVALDRAVKLADLLDASDRVQRWQAEADRIRETVLREAWHEEARAFTGAFGSDHLDASVLLLPLVGFIPADDDRMLATLGRSGAVVPRRHGVPLGR